MPNFRSYNWLLQWMRLCSRGLLVTPTAPAALFRNRRSLRRFDGLLYRRLLWHYLHRPLCGGEPLQHQCLRGRIVYRPMLHLLHTDAATCLWNSALLA